jgi:hypothetical protein
MINLKRHQCVGGGVAAILAPAAGTLPYQPFQRGIHAGSLSGVFLERKPGLGVHQFDEGTDAEIAFEFRPFGGRQSVVLVLERGQDNRREIRGS